MKRLGCFGSNCVDYYGNLNGGTAFLGGGPLNSAVHARRQGVEASFVSAGGEDRYGQGYCKVLERYQIDASCFHLLPGKSALCEVTLEENERILGDYEEGVYASFRLSEKDTAFLKEHDILLTDYWGHQEDFFPALRASGALLALDAADRVGECEALLHDVDILFFSGSGMKDAEKRIKALAEKGPGLIVATFGKDGSIAYDGTFHYGGIFPCEKIVDTLGAGDAFIGTFLAAYLQEETIEICLQKAAEAASYVLTYYGAFPQEGCL